MRTRLESPFTPGVRASAVPIAVSGSVAFETFGRSRSRLVGGSAVHFALAARFLAPVEIAATVGRDFRRSDLEALDCRGVSTLGIGVVDGPTARAGSAGSAPPRVPTQRPRARANGPELAFAFLLPAEVPTTSHAGLEPLAAGWRGGARTQLGEVAGVVVLSTSELRGLTGIANIVRAGRRLQRSGPALVVVTHGPYGASVFGDDFYCKAPAFPVARVVDGTDAAASFAGGFMGAIAASGGQLSDECARNALLCGTVLASFTVEGFGASRCSELSLADLADRYERFLPMIQLR